MNIPAEFAQEFATFPTALRALVEVELVAGNAITAIEHGFPAAPCGASIKLARAVSEARRNSTGEISFYARNNSSYAGEFTTAERHFFVLEPPLPTPPPPDMDAIRQAIEPQSSHLAQIAARSTRSYRLTPDKSPAARAFTNTETRNGWTRVLYFSEHRTPHEVQVTFERDLMVLFVARMVGGQLRLSTTAHVNGAQYDFDIQFIAALHRENHFMLRVVAEWGDSDSHRDYFRKTSDSWFKSWVCDLTPATPPDAQDNLAERYQELCEAALNAERHLDSMAAVQRAIVDGVKRGGSFGTSHKEGGTNIFWRHGKFVRSDYGDYPDYKVFADEAEFLKVLWNFFQFDVTRSADKRQLPELDAWKLILRRMSPTTPPYE